MPVDLDVIGGIIHVISLKKCLSLETYSSILIVLELSFIIWIVPGPDLGLPPI